MIYKHSLQSGSQCQPQFRNQSKSKNHSRTRLPRLRIEHPSPNRKRLTLSNIPQGFRPPFLPTPHQNRFTSLVIRTHHHHQQQEEERKENKTPPRHCSFPPPPSLFWKSEKDESNELNGPTSGRKLFSGNAPHPIYIIGRKKRQFWAKRHTPPKVRQHQVLMKTGRTFDSSL
ncbi:hypothetical protein CDAR_457201 [Caerostris darwini]|uniref:Uncharacterized protein n=1 Tax=Caerostris darwini TaxID=1538125 RepID=A0AAV4PBJ2_9ARAC|nr:hypothetical protein CDAR_457201 [Caerostris darwini]